MRGNFTPVTKIRRQVFEAVARQAFESRGISDIFKIPFNILPGELPTYRESIFKERAIVSERIRLAMGLPLRKISEQAPMTNGMEDPELEKKVYSMPFINVIPFACNACETTHFRVTDSCQGCLAHPCTSICPVNAVTIVKGRSVIDREKCIKCGRCSESCPYGAIIKMERPCAAACGVDAIGSDEYGRAKIDEDKCVACGQCMVHCPFAAISDKSQIYQLAKALMGDGEVVAEIAPSFVGQFGPAATPQKIKGALRKMGFRAVYEVAAGADQVIVEEAEHYIHKVATGEQPFLATSCCPSWSVMAKREFPQLEEYLSESLTPMVATARLIKKERPNAKVCFIGPCAAKKLEAMRRSVRSDVDFVITFEELMGMFAAKDIEFGEVEEEPIDDASAGGRGFAVAGGVASSVVDAIHEMDPSVEVKTDRAEGLKNCKKMLLLAKAGKRNGYLLEGMCCYGGCVAGAGTVSPIPKAAGEVKKFMDAASVKSAVVKIRETGKSMPAEIS